MAFWVDVLNGGGEEQGQRTGSVSSENLFTFVFIVLNLIYFLCKPISGLDNSQTPYSLPLTPYPSPFTPHPSPLTP